MGEFLRRERTVREYWASAHDSCTGYAILGLVATLSDQISALLSRALDDADNPSIPTSVVVRKALRVARLRSDWEGVLWLTMELRGGDDKEAKNRAGLEIASHLTAEEMSVLWKQSVEAFISERNLGDETGIFAASIPEAEIKLASFHQEAAQMQPPPGLHTLDLYHESQRLEKQRLELGVAAMQLEQMLARVRSRAADYLSRTEHQIAFGQVNADVWERNRAYVDAELAKLAPDALTQFQAAYKRQAENDSEARSHALTSCRRVLKSLADVLYPATNQMATGSDGKERRMTDDKFISRLGQYVGENAHGSAGQLVEVEVNDLGSRLDALNSLSSKGVHAQVTQAEVDLCLIRTYLLAGDLLRIHAGSSAALQSTGPITM